MKEPITNRDALIASLKRPSPDDFLLNHLTLPYCHTQCDCTDEDHCRMCKDAWLSFPKGERS